MAVFDDFKKKAGEIRNETPSSQAKAASQPQQTNWYKGAQPTARETGAQVFRVGTQDPSQQAELNRLFQLELDNPNGPIYQPYRKATTTSYTKTNLQNTQKGQQEWAGLQDELSYWAGRSDLNLSDDEIINRINWKNYPTLVKMDEQAALGTPLALVEGIGYSQDAMYGVLWAARNPGQSTGDALYDSIQGQLGRGNQFKANDVNGWRDATSDSYAPYKAGATALDDLAYKYRMDGSFDMDWLNTQGRALLNGDEQMKKDYNRIYQVVTQTDKIDAELQKYRAEVNAAITSGLDPRAVFYEGMMEEEYPELYKAYEGQRSGKLTETSRALDFDFASDVLAMQNAYQKKAGTMDDADFADDVAALLGLPTLNNEAQKAVTRQTNEQLQAAGSIFAKDFTPSESAAMYTASAGYMPTKQQLVQSILNGTAGDNEAYTSAMDAANAYASEFWLNSVNKLKELENHLKAFDEYDALVKEWDKVRNAENVDENARWEYEEKFAALEPQKSVWKLYESRDELVSAIENEKRIQANTLKMFSDAERLNTNGQSSGSVMPLLTFVDAFGGYESVRYPNTEWGKAMSEGSDWATVSKSIAEQEKSNGVMLRMINTALKQAEQYGLGEDYTRGLIAARDDIVRENQLMQYDKLHGAKDFDSQVSAFDKSQTAAEPKFIYIRGSASDAEVYRAGIVDMEKALAAYGDDDTRLLYPGQMTDFEKETYKYLFMTQGEEAATGYVEALIPMLHVRHREGVLERADDATSTIAGTIGANALTVLGNLTGVFSLASNAISSLTGEEVDPYSPTFSISAFSGRVRENTRKAIGDDNPWVVAYDAGMAAADSLTAALAGGGSQFITLALQSGNAANASLMEAKMRGASDQQAWMYASASAAAEVITEAGPVGNLLDAYAKGGTKAFKEVLKRQMIAEGLGELGSEILNTVADNAIMQELSQYNASVEQYMAEGYTEEAAKSMAATDVVANVFYSGMLGAVSAAPSVSASYAAGALNKRKQNKFKSRAEAALSKAQSDGAGKPAQAAAMAAAMEAGGSNPEDADAAASAMAQTDPQATYTLWSVLEHSNEFDAVSAVELGALVPDSQTGNLFAMIKEEGATEENVAQLIETANQEMADPEVKAKYDAAIASYEEGSATMGAMLGADLSGVKNAQKNVENTSRRLQTARTSLEAARASMKSASTVLQNAQKRFSNDHGDKATAAVIKAKEKYQKAQQTLEGAKQADSSAQKDYDSAKAELETVKQNTLAEIRQQGVTARDQIMANRQAVQEQQAAEAEAKRQSDNVAAMEADNFVEDNYADAPDDKKAELRDQYIGQMPKRDMEGFKSGVELLSRASRKFGFKMQIVDDLSGAEGGYLRDENTIYVTKDITQTEAIKRVLLHEMTHAAEGAGRLYTEMRDALLSLKYHGNQTKLDADVNALMKDYNAFYKKRNMIDKKTGQVKQLTREQAMQELTANINAEIISGNQELIEQLVSESPSAARRIMNNIKNAIAKMLGVRDPMLDQARKVVGMFEQALGEAKKNGAVSSDGEMQFNVNPSSWYDYSKPFSEQVDDWVAGKIPKNDTLLVCATPDVFQKIGLSKLPMTIDQTHVDYAINGSKNADHHMGAAMLKQLPELLKDPIAIVESQTRPDDSLVVVVDGIVNGKQMMAAIEVGGIGITNNKKLDVNEITTTQGRSNTITKLLYDAVKKENGGTPSVYYWKKTEAQNLFASAGVQFSGGAIQDGLIHSIFDAGSSVNKKFLEQTDTRQFKRWFGDSKVTNEDGTPKVVYHGTDAYNEISVFKKGKRGYLGPGIYLTDSENVAKSYANKNGYDGRVYAMYASIKNPLYISDLSDPGRELLEAAYGKKGLYEKRLEKQSNATFIITGTDIKKLQAKGYDGIVWKGEKSKDAEYMVFDPAQIKSATDNTGTFDPLNPDIRYSLPSTDIINRQMAAYREGQQYTGEANYVGESQFATKTGQNTTVLSDAVKRELAASPFYKKTSEKGNVNQALKLIENEGYESRKNKLLDGSTDLLTPEGQAEAYVLAKVAKDKGDVEGESAIAFRVKESGTQLAQSLAMRRMYVEMTPAGKVQYVQRIVDGINRNYQKTGNATRVEVPSWLEGMLGAAQNAEQTNAVLQEAYADIGRQMPPDWKTRINGWRYMSMLFNTRTHIRNMLGNAMFAPAISLKNQIAAAMEAKSGITDRTKTLGKVSKEYKDFASAQLASVKDALTGGGKMSAADEVAAARRTFKSPTLEAISKFNGDMLEKEDAFFLNRHFTNALAGYLQANKVDLNNVDPSVLQAGLEYAIQEAQKATYRDASAFADAISKFSNNLNNSESAATRMAGLMFEGTLPFKKTPINVVRRGIEYSPVGLISSLTAGRRQLKKGKITQAEFYDRLASGMTGTMIAAAGALLYSLGAIELSLDDEEGKLKELEGKQEYSVNVRLFDQDISMTIDWLSPSAMPLFVGAAVEKLREDGVESLTIEGLWDAMLNIAEPMFNLSMLDGVNSLLSAASYSENGVADVAMRALEGYAGQFVPTTLGAIARTLDSTRRTTYTDKTTGVPSSLQYLWNSTVNKIPGLSTSGQPYLNAWGEADKTDSFLLRAAENFLIPGYVNTVQMENNELEEKLMEMFDATGENGLIPKAPSKYFTVNGKRRDLTGAEYEQLTRERGQVAQGLHEQLFANEDFLALAPEYQVSALGYVWDYSTQLAKSNIDADVKVDNWILNARDNPMNAILEKVDSVMLSDKKDQYKSSLYDAIDNNDIDQAVTCVQALKDLGVTTSSLKTSLTNHYKSRYIKMYTDGDVDGMRDLEESLAAVPGAPKNNDMRKWITKE